MKWQYGKPVVEPLERYGKNAGNCMRRILSQLLPGAAITSVKIDGVLHEFSTIPGVKEDVTEIIPGPQETCCKNQWRDEEKRKDYQCCWCWRSNSSGYHRWFRYGDFQSRFIHCTLAENATFGNGGTSLREEDMYSAEQNKSRFNSYSSYSSS